MKKLNRGDQVSLINSTQIGYFWSYIDEDIVILLLNDETEKTTHHISEIELPIQREIAAIDIVFDGYSGPLGNAFMVIGRVNNAARQLGADKEQIAQYQVDACKGDYDDLLLTSVKFLQTLGLQ